MPKRNVAYIKPEEPKFLKRIKEQIGYKEGPTINTKRESYSSPTTEDLEDGLDEQPTVVVLEPGDLTADEVAKINEEEFPADLSKPIVFKPTSKVTKENENTTAQDSNRKLGAKSKKKSKKIQAALLSFNDDVEDEND